MPVISKEPPLPPWGYALSGAAGAVIANTLVYPLDIAKTRIQTQLKNNKNKNDKLESSNTENIENLDDIEYHGTIDTISKIIKYEGITGLYNGLPGTIVGVAATNFAYFYWYGLIRTAWGRRHAYITTSMELLIGALAGALAQLFTLPISVVTTRQQTAKGKERTLSMLQTAAKIIKVDGPLGLWRGFKASLILVSNPSITYGSYQKYKTLLFPGKKNFTPIQSFILGALSKATATILTQPMIVAKVLVQASAGKKVKSENTKKPNGKLTNEETEQVDKKDIHFDNFISAILYLGKSEGLSGLFKGLGPQLSKGVIVQGLLFLFRDQINLLIILLFRWYRLRRTLAVK